MKKILLFLLLACSVSTFAQADFPEGISLSGNGPTISTTKLISQEPTNGNLNHIDAVTLPISNPVKDSLQKKLNLPTGFIQGLQLSINADPTKVNIAAGYYTITDFTDLTNPVVTIKTFAGLTGYTPAYLNSANATYIALDINGNVVASASPFTNSQRRTLAIIGSAIHSNLTTVNVTNEIKAPIIAPTNQLHDFMRAIGFLNEKGNIYSPNGANLRLNKSAGKIFGMGINAADYTNPHQLLIPSQTALTFAYRFQGGTQLSDTKNINPNIYDVGGVSTPTPSNKWTIQRINLFQSGLARIQPGQTVYNSFNDATIALPTQPFVTEQNIADNAVFRCYLIVQQGTTNLSSAVAGGTAQFIPVDKFGNVIGNGSVALTYANIVAALGYTPENVANKAIDFSVINDQLYPTVKAVNDRLPTTYTKIVYVNNVNPNSATIFDLENPPVTNADLLKNDTANLYIGTDASTWVYNGATYVTKTVTSATSNFYLVGTTTDAGNSKTANIYRTGSFSETTLLTANPIGDTSNRLKQFMATNDNWSIYGDASVLDQGKMVFEVGDNGDVESGTGQSFEFRYNANTSGVSKTPFKIDYNNITALANITATSFIKSGTTSTNALLAGGGSLANPVSGTGANGRVSFWDGVSTQSGDNNLFWDNTNKRLGIGNTNPSEKLEVNGTIKASGIRPIRLLSATGAVTTTFPTTGGFAIGSYFLDNTEVTKGGFGAYGNTNLIEYHYIGADYLNPLIKILANGNTLIGTTVDDGVNQLQVNGSAKFASSVTSQGLNYGKAINYTGDLNDLTEAGFYDGDDLINAPTNGWFHYSVQRHIYSDSDSDSWVFQTATGFGAPFTTGTYTRTKSNGSWQPWRRIWDDGNFSPDDKVDRVAGKSLISDSEITRLATVTNQDISGKFDKTGGTISGNTSVTGTVTATSFNGSATLTGTPAAPTATAGDNDTSIATTAFVTTANNLKANLASPTFTGTPAAPTATAGTNTTQIATTAFVLANSSARPYRVYTALISQEGTSAPTATVLENTLGGTVVWSRSNVGVYVGTLENGFSSTLSKVRIFISGGEPFLNTTGFYNALPNHINSVQVNTKNTSGSLADSLMSAGATIEIRVYK